MENYDSHLKKLGLTSDRAADLDSICQRRTYFQSGAPLRSGKTLRKLGVGYYVRRESEQYYYNLGKF